MIKKLYNNCFKIMCLIFAMCLCVLGISYTYHSFIKQYAGSDKKIISVQNQVKQEKIKNNSVVEQFFVTDEAVKKFNIRFSLYDDTKTKSDDSVGVELLNADNTNVIQKWELAKSEITEETQQFVLESVEDGKKIGRFIIRISFKGENEYSGIGIYKSESSLYNKGDLIINGNRCTGDLAFSVYAGNNTFLKHFFAVLVIILVGGGIITGWLAFKTNVCPEKIFIFLAILLGGMHMILMPTYSTPDERTHFATAYYYSNLLMGQEAVDAEGKVLVRNEDLLLNIENMRPTLGTYALINDNLFKSCQDDNMVSLGVEPLSVPFWSYAPQTVGITVARLLNMGNIMLFFLSDFFALLSYVSCVYCAIKWIPFGKITMMIIALFPMALETASSFSYDVLVNGISLLFIGYVFYLIYEKKRAHKKDWVLLSILMFIMAPIKVVYVLLSFLCLLIPVNNKKKVCFGAVVTVLSGVVSCALLRLTLILQLSGVSNISERSTTVSNTYTITYILSHLSRVIAVLYNTLRNMSDAILSPLFGQRLGVWDISIPYCICFAMVFLLICSLIITEKEEVMIKSWQKCYMMLLCVGMLGGITLAMMLDFTDISDTVIRGIQGRYFTPFLPLIVFCFRNKTVVLKKSIDRYLIFAIYILNYFTLWRIFETVIIR